VLIHACWGDLAAADVELAQLRDGIRREIADPATWRIVELIADALLQGGTIKGPPWLVLVCRAAGMRHAPIRWEEFISWPGARELRDSTVAAAAADEAAARNRRIDKMFCSIGIDLSVVGNVVALVLLGVVR
jgi:hypothetical protein